MERYAWRYALAQARTSQKCECCLKPWVMHECVADMRVGRPVLVRAKCATRRLPQVPARGQPPE